MWFVPVNTMPTTYGFGKSFPPQMRVIRSGGCDKERFNNGTLKACVCVERCLEHCQRTARPGGVFCFCCVIFCTDGDSFCFREYMRGHALGDFLIPPTSPFDGVVVPKDVGLPCCALS